MRTKKLIDLRWFDSIIEKELDKHVVNDSGSRNSTYFIPGLYQTLGNELGFYKQKCFAEPTFSTKAFSSAYMYEDRNEIIDELFCILSSFIAGQLGIKRIKYGLRVEFLSHNQWLISHLEDNDAENVIALARANKSDQR